MSKRAGIPSARNMPMNGECCAEFYARKTGWVPVDISEAWKAKQKEDYFFGRG